jgi:hypothetical protein
MNTNFIFVVIMRNKNNLIVINEMIITKAIYIRKWDYFYVDFPREATF